MQDLVKTFCEFVSIDSVSGEEKPFSDFLLQKIQALGFEPIQDERGNIFLKLAGTGEPILLCAHLDTVEPGHGIEPVVGEDGFIHSAGETILGSDNKAIVAVFFEIIKSLSKANSHRAVEFLFSVSEESDFSGVDSFDFSVSQAKFGLCCDVSKPVGTIVLGSPYYIFQKIIIEGVSADISQPEKGQTVLASLAYLLENAPQSDMDKGVSYNIGKLQGGTAINALLSSAELVAEIRAFEEITANDYEKQKRDLLAEIEQKFQCKIIYETEMQNHGYKFSQDDEFVQSIAETLSQIAPVEYMERYWGLADANSLNHKGIKTVNLGYGNLEAHTTRERIHVDDLEKMYNFVKLFLSVS